MERTDFNTITELPVRLVMPEQGVHFERGQVLIKRGKKIIGFVQMDNLFDADGNNFQF